MAAVTDIPDVRIDPDLGQGRQEVRVAVLAESVIESDDETATMTAEDTGNMNLNLLKILVRNILLIYMNSNIHAGQLHQLKPHHMVATLIDRRSIIPTYRDRLIIQCVHIIPMDDPQIATNEGFWNSNFKNHLTINSQILVTLLACSVTIRRI
jgi:hypothetical protein